MACRAPHPQQLVLPLAERQASTPAARQPAAREVALAEGRRLTLDERMERRETWCESHEMHACRLCEGPTDVQPPKRKRRACEEGVDLRALNLEDPYAARRLVRRAKTLLSMGAEPAAVHAETGIRMNTLHQLRSRMREDERDGK